MIKVNQQYFELIEDYKISYKVLLPPAICSTKLDVLIERTAEYFELTSIVKQIPPRFLFKSLMKALIMPYSYGQG